MRIFFVLFMLFLFSTQHVCAQNATGKTDEKFYTTLGGEKQYVEIRGNSTKQPVLLFIHGGPGWPQTPQLRYFNAPLADSFILATWDQRGCGLSSLKDSMPPNVTLAQIVSDAHELTLLLKKKFNVAKIFLAGYSWGSVVGLMLAEKYPDDYYAYAGIAQVINMQQALMLSRQWITEKAKQLSDTATLNALQKLNNKDTSFCNSPLDCFMQQYALLSKFNGALYNPAAEEMEETSMAAYADYKSYNWNKGFEYSATRLQDDLFNADFSHRFYYKIPIIFFEGRHDWNVPAVLVEAYEKEITAPAKDIVWFEQSGHGIPYEEPELFNSVFPARLKALANNTNQQ